MRASPPMSGDGAFSYRCNACKRCCHHKAIRVGPYETLRLASRLGLTTTAFLAAHTESGGVYLRQTDSGACQFLDARGCSVHSDRPLACRLYPLMRWTSPQGVVSYSEIEPTPGSEGIYARDGRVADYLAQQGVAPFFEMSDAYGALYQRLLDALGRVAPAEVDKRAERRDALSALTPGELGSALLDVDATLATYCAENDLAVPTTVEARASLHIKAVGEWIDRLEAELSPPAPE